MVDCMPGNRIGQAKTVVHQQLSREEAGTPSHRQNLRCGLPNQPESLEYHRGVIVEFQIRAAQLVLLDRDKTWS